MYGNRSCSDSRPHNARHTSTRTNFIEIRIRQRHTICSHDILRFSGRETKIIIIHLPEERFWRMRQKCRPRASTKTYNCNELQYVVGAITRGSIVFKIPECRIYPFRSIRKCGISLDVSCNSLVFFFSRVKCYIY